MAGNTVQFSVNPLQTERTLKKEDWGRELEAGWGSRFKTQAIVKVSEPKNKNKVTKQPS
jgi:hypothetical protein